jgi:hypothetical protein
MGFIPIGFIPIGFIPIGFVLIGFIPIGFVCEPSLYKPPENSTKRTYPLSIPFELALVQDLVVQFVCLSGSSFGSCRSPPIPYASNVHSVKERIISEENFHFADTPRKNYITG